MKIRSRMMFIILSTTLVALVLSSVVLYRTSHSIVQDLVFVDIKDQAKQYARQVQVEMENMIASTRVLKTALAEMDGLPPADRRGYYNRLLRSSLVSEPRFLAVWTTWDNNALDGMDSQFVNKDGSNEIGRFTATWYRGSDGEISLENTTEDDLSDADYFLLAKQTKQEFLLEPNMYSYTGDPKDNTWQASIVQPIWDGDTFKGEVGVDISLDTFQKNLAPVRPFSKGYAMLVSNGGLVVVDPDSTAINKSVFELDPELTAIGKRISWPEKIKSGADYSFERPVSGNQTSEFFQFVPVTVGLTQSPWSMGLSVPNSVIDNLAGGILWVFVIVTGITAIVLGIVVFMAARFIVNPLGRVSARIMDISQGNGDLTQRVRISTRDEIGELSKHFNTFADYLQSVVEGIKENSRGVRAVGESLSHAASDSASSIEEIRINVEGMKDKAVRLDLEIGKAVTVTDELREFIQAFLMQVGAQSDGIRQSTQSLGSISRNIAEAAQASRQRLDEVRTLQDIARDGQNSMAETIATNRRVTEATALVSGTLKIINTIAAQTNLLAMNASIEAAHAGVYGQGFAVVADEIRKLAESASKNSKRISDSLKEIMDLIKASETSSEKSNELFGRIVGEIDQISQGIGEVGILMDSLSVEGRNIESSLVSIISRNEELREASLHTDQNIDRIGMSVASIRNISTDNRSGMEEIASGVGEIWRAMQKVSEASVENAENIGQLENLVGRLKTRD